MRSMNKIFGKIKNTSQLLIWLALSLLAGGCTAENDYPDVPGGGIDNTYTIKLSTGTMSRADGTVDGVGVENLIDDYVIFFYPSGSDEKTAPVYAVSGDPADTYSTATVTVKLTDDQVDKIFGSGDKCSAYALVNIPDGTKNASGEELRNKVTIDTEELTINGQLATVENIEKTKIYRRFGTADVPSEFVMRGQSDDITLNEATRQLTGTISLKRVAAKVRLFVNIPDTVFVAGNNRSYRDSEVEKIIKEKMAPPENKSEGQARFEFHKEVLEDGGQICVPRKNNSAAIKVFMNNGCRVARIDGVTREDDKRWMDTWDDHNPYFTALRNNDGERWQMNITKTGATNWEWDNYERSHGTPIYTYPNFWELSAEEEHQSYMLLELQWQIIDRENESAGSWDFQKCYYQVPINSQSTTSRHQIESNKYYRVGLNVGMLGSINIGEPQEIKDATWEVLDWTQEDVHMSLKEGTYLVFNETDYVLNNEQSIEIPFVTSHEVEVKNVYVTYFRFNDSWNAEFTNRASAYGNLTDGEGELNNNNYGMVYSWNGYYDGVYYEGRNHPRTITTTQLNETTTYNTQNNAANWRTYNEKFDIDAMYTCTVEGDKLVFNHPLIRWQERWNNNTTGTGSPAYYTPVMNTAGTGFKDAYSRYDITIEIGFVGDGASSELMSQRKKIHIVQYPAMYIEEMNNATKTPTANFSAGYASVNNSRSTSVNTGQNNRNYNYGTVNDMSNSDNTNRNMYSITISRLSEDESALGYKIGDPRTLGKNINLSDESFNNQNTANTRWGQFSYTTNTGWFNQTYYFYGPVNASSYYDGSTQGNNVSINDYYPADEIPNSSAGTKYNMIAPKLRVASSWGATSDIFTKEIARRRCASYQEFGYPGGRWRLPTMAEVKYIVQLSTDGLIPYLFGSSGNTNADYYTAQGVIRVNNGTNTVTENPTNANPVVRCVYDDWYWVKKDGTEDRLPQNMWTTFTWGDKPKDNPQLGD